MAMAMAITFFGHLSRDIDIVRGVAERRLGGGVVHNALTAARVGGRARVLTRVIAADVAPAKALFEPAGVELVIDLSPTPTSIENAYENGCPDSRVSRLVSRAEPFSAGDLGHADGSAAHVNPLWYPEFPPLLLPQLRERTPFLSLDAQGFLRRAAADGRLRLVDWEEKGRYLPLLDLLKVDGCEAYVMTGERDPGRAAAALGALGVRTVIVTRAGDAGVWHEGRYWTFDLGPYDLAHRTGRGDTFTAAYLVARGSLAPRAAARVAVEVTKEKLTYPGPYRGASAV